jgi:hypothetical protein
VTPDEAPYAVESVAVARTGDSGGVVVAAGGGHVFSGWGAGDLQAVAVTALAPGAEPAVASDGAGHVLAVWSSDGSVLAARGTADGRIRWKKPVDLGPGAAPAVGWDGTGYRIAWQDGASVVQAAFDRHLGEVTRLDGQLGELACGTGCALSYWTGSQWMLADPEGTKTLQGQPFLARGVDGTWQVWTGMIQRPAGPVATGYRMGRPVALEVRGALLDWYVAEDGALFRAEVDGDHWLATGVGVPGEPADGLAVDRRLAAWFACTGPEMRIRTGFTDRDGHHGWDPAAVVEAAAGAGVVAVGTVADGGVRLEEVLKGQVHAGDWLAGTGEHPDGAHVLVVTPPGRITTEKWSFLELSDRPAVEAAMTRAGCGE